MTHRPCDIPQCPEPASDYVRRPVDAVMQWFCREHHWRAVRDLEERRERENARARRRSADKRAQSPLLAYDDAMTQGEGLTTWKTKDDGGQSR
jgi:hypothetical protein